MHATTLAEVIGKVNNGYPVDKLISGVARTKLRLEEEMCPRTNIRAYFCANGGYCVRYPLNRFHNTRSFQNWGKF